MSKKSNVTVNLSVIIGMETFVILLLIAKIVNGNAINEIKMPTTDALVDSENARALSTNPMASLTDVTSGMDKTKGKLSELEQRKEELKLELELPVDQNAFNVSNRRGVHAQHGREKYRNNVGEGNSCNNCMNFKFPAFGPRMGEKKNERMHGNPRMNNRQ